MSQCIFLLYSCLCCLCLCLPSLLVSVMLLVSVLPVLMCLLSCGTVLWCTVLCRRPHRQQRPQRHQSTTVQQHFAVVDIFGVFAAFVGLLYLPAIEATTSILRGMDTSMLAMDIRPYISEHVDTVRTRMVVSVLSVLVFFALLCSCLGRLCSCLSSYLCLLSFAVSADDACCRVPSLLTMLVVVCRLC